MTQVGPRQGRPADQGERRVPGPLLDRAAQDGRGDAAAGRRQDDEGRSRQEGGQGGRQDGVIGPGRARRPSELRRPGGPPPVGGGGLSCCGAPRMAKDRPGVCVERHCPRAAGRRASCGPCRGGCVVVTLPPEVVMRPAIVVPWPGRLAGTRETLRGAREAAHAWNAGGRWACSLGGCADGNLGGDPGPIPLASGQSCGSLQQEMNRLLGKGVQGNVERARQRQEAHAAAAGRCRPLQLPCSTSISAPAATFDLLRPAGLAPLASVEFE